MTCPLTLLKSIRKTGGGVCVGGSKDQVAKSLHHSQVCEQGSRELMLSIVRGEGHDLAANGCESMAM